MFEVRVGILRSQVLGRGKSSNDSEDEDGGGSR